MVEVHCVGGGKVPVLGKGMVEFTVVGERFFLNMLIIDTQDDVILGADFLSGQDMTINLGQGQIQMGHTQVFSEKDTDKSPILSTLRAVYLPPNSENSCKLPAVTIGI